MNERMDKRMDERIIMASADTRPPAQGQKDSQEAAQCSTCAFFARNTRRFSAELDWSCFAAGGKHYHCASGTKEPGSSRKARGIRIH